MADGVYFDDPSEAVGYLRDKVLGKRLGGAGMEIRPTALPSGPTHLGLARMKAANRMDLAVIPRVAIASAKKGQVPLWVIPPADSPVDDVPGVLAAAAAERTCGRGNPWRVPDRVPEGHGTGSDDRVREAGHLRDGRAPGQGWQWISRGGDQLPG